MLEVGKNGHKVMSFGWKLEPLYARNESCEQQNDKEKTSESQ